MRKCWMVFAVSFVLMTLAGETLWAQTPGAAVEGNVYIQRLAKQRNKHNLKRDMGAFKRSNRRDWLGLRKEIIMERQALREESGLRRQALRLALDVDADGRVSRQELMLGRDRIKSLQKEGRLRWAALRIKQKKSLSELKKEKKKEYQEIKDKFHKAGGNASPISSNG